MADITKQDQEPEVNLDDKIDDIDEIDETIKDEEVIEEEDKDDESVDEEEDEEVKDIKNEAIPAFKEVDKKYPKFFKDFPGFRHMFFREREYSKVFASVEEAQEALEAVESLQNFESSITSGDMEDLNKTLKSFKELGDDVIPSLAINFLPALKKSSPDDYYTAVTPLMVTFVRNLYDNGVRNGNENLKNAGLLAAIHFFEDADVATGKRQIASGSEKKKDVSLENDRQQFKQERYTTFYNDVVQDSNSRLESMVKNGLDPKDLMSDKMQQMVTREIISEIDKILTSDRSHTSRMNSLWKKAGESNFARENKARILNAYLGRAKELLPTIRSKVRNAALGTKQINKDKVKDRTEPKGGGNGSRSSSSSKNIDSKNIDWSKTTDLDVIRGNITYRK